MMRAGRVAPSLRASVPALLFWLSVQASGLTDGNRISHAFGQPAKRSVRGCQLMSGAAVPFEAEAMVVSPTA